MEGVEVDPLGGSGGVDASAAKLDAAQTTSWDGTRDAL